MLKGLFVYFMQWYIGASDESIMGKNVSYVVHHLPLKLCSNYSSLQNIRSCFDKCVLSSQLHHILNA